MLDAIPAHLADVDQAIDAAEIDKRAKVTQTAHDPLALLPDFEFGHDLAASFFLHFFQTALRLSTRLRRSGLASVTRHSIV